MTVYNEIEPFAAFWLRNLIEAGCISKGVVNETSICDLRPDDLAGADRVHLFAGIAGWDLALAISGWPAELPVWTGSCPCQPFSVAGKGKGTKDHRDLWPDMHRLIKSIRPPCVLGEQVPGAIGHGWLDRVSRDLEAEGYQVGAVVLGAHSVGAPHIRQRLYWVAYSAESRLAGARQRAGTDGIGTDQDAQRGFSISESSIGGADERLGNSPGLRPARTNGSELQECGLGERCVPEHWSDSYWHPCRDPKRGTVYRRVPTQSELFPLAHGVSGRMDLVRTRIEGGTPIQETKKVSRVGTLKGAGNAIVPSVAAVFIRSFMSLMGIS